MVKANAGQKNQKGINAQNWAAMSLFLQFHRDKSFSYIQLEPNDSEDFDLYFTNGKRIICESKYKNRQLTYADLKKVLNKISSKKSVSNQDEILLICKKVSDDLLDKVKYIKYFKEAIKYFKRRDFNSKAINLLPQVNFWVVNKNRNQEACYSLLRELIGIWLKQEEIQRYVDSILQSKITEKSLVGAIYSRDNFDTDLTEFKKEIQERSDYFNDKRDREKQFSLLEKDIKKNKGIQWGSASISAFSNRLDLMSFAIERLKERKDLDLEKWSDLWQIDNIPYFTYWLFHIFKNNLHGGKNKKYVIEYCKNNIKKTRNYYYRFDYFIVETISIIFKILETTPDPNNLYLNDSFLIIKKLVNFDKEKFFYLKNTDINSKEREKEETSSLIKKIFQLSHSKLKQEVIGLIIENFNIIEDDGNFWHYSPQEIFETLLEWLNEDFEKRFPTFIESIIKQYENFYKSFSRKLKFDGWDHSGSSVSFAAGEHYIRDRHFIQFVLINSIGKFYKENEVKAWNFIKQRCIIKTKDVDKNHPDFLNRSIWPIVLERYAHADINLSKEALNILKEFILSEKGIPSKSELIYQAVVESNLPDEKKWQLVKLTIDKYPVPISVFVEKIVSNLAQKRFVPAEEILVKWFSDLEYYRNWNKDYISTISSLFNVNFELASRLLTTLIKSEYVKSRTENSFLIAGLLRNLLRKNYERGLSILRELESEEQLSETQQIIYVASLFNTQGEDDSDDSELLLKIYRDIVAPFLERHKDSNSEIVKRLNYPYSRELLVKFADRLANKKHIVDALRIIRIFINDPDPNTQLENILKGEKPRIITSVRGWCGWVLMQCVNLEGREYLPEIIKLTEQLVKEDNYYIVHAGCWSLSHIANNRLKVLPNDHSVLFFNDDMQTALKMAKQVEAIAFSLLNRFIKWDEPVQKALSEDILQVFGSIRALNEQVALQLVQIFAGLPNEMPATFAPLFFYFAEFRKNDLANWKFHSAGFYDDLKPEQYDDKKFKQILVNVIKMLQKTNTDSCYKFILPIEQIIGNDQKNDMLAIKYLDLLAEVYSRSVFESIYRIIKRKFNDVGNQIEGWFKLLIKCLKIEWDFYDKHFNDVSTMQLGRHSTFYHHSEILVSLYERDELNNFLEAAEIFFSFPKETMFHISERISKIIEELMRHNDTKVRERAIGVAKKLKNIKPGEYLHLKIK